VNVLPELRAQLVAAAADAPRRRPAAAGVGRGGPPAPGCAVLAVMVIRLLGTASAPVPELPAAAPPSNSPAPLFPSDRYAGTPYPIALATGSNGVLCLIASPPSGRQLQRCDPGPAPDRPFGPVMRIVDDKGRRLLYGLVANGVDRVRVAGVATPVVPARSAYGRLFFTPLNTSYVDLAALDEGGVTLGTLGGRPGTGEPLSYDEARATGNPAAFAPTAVKRPTPATRGTPATPAPATPAPTELPPALKRLEETTP
jgi:hypothetical protein